MSADGTTLTLAGVTKADSGVYTCMAGNIVGSMTADAGLTVAASSFKHPTNTHQ